MKFSGIKYGIMGGVAGGMVFGMMMGMMGMLPMIGKMVGAPYASVGFLLHMFNSALIGAGFSLLLRGEPVQINRGLPFGLLYGAFWWILGPLTMMPLMMGKGLLAHWNLTAMVKMTPSLMGHLIYGAILGAAYSLLSNGRLFFQKKFA